MDCRQQKTSSSYCWVSTSAPFSSLLVRRAGCPAVSPENIIIVILVTNCYYAAAILDIWQTTHRRLTLGVDDGCRRLVVAKRFLALRLAVILPPSSILRVGSGAREGVIRYAVSVVISLALSMSVIARPPAHANFFSLQVLGRVGKAPSSNRWSKWPSSLPPCLVCRLWLLGGDSGACACPECLCSRHYHFAHHLLHSDLALFLTRFWYGQPSCRCARLTEKLERAFGDMRRWI